MLFYQNVHYDTNTDAGSSAPNHNLSQFLPFLNPPGPEEQTKWPRTKVFYAMEVILKTNSKETMKTEAQKVTKLAKEKYSVLKDTLIKTFANIYSLLRNLM